MEAAANLAGTKAAGWNVIKLRNDPGKVTLLNYPGFFDEPFPCLMWSTSIDLQTGSVRNVSYNGKGDPPILHRKELLLPENHPERARFAELTRALEQRGLLSDTARIGRRSAWERRLAEAGVRVEGHVLVNGADAETTGSEQTQLATAVDRHRTAIERDQLSAPMQMAARHGLLSSSRRVFDYGCGRGSDVEVLRAAGIEAAGWDPFYAPETTVQQAEVVNLGFVINVVEDPAERRTCVRQAYALATEVLSVAVMTWARADVSTLTRYGDGFLTSRNTFQKYYSREEIQTLLREETGEEPVAVAPGIFFVFRDKIAEQRFFEERSRRRRDISHLLSIAPSKPHKSRRKADALLEQERDLIERVWTRALELGRAPQPGELDPDDEEALRARVGSVRRALQLAQRVHDPSALTCASAERLADLRVYFALDQFDRRRRFASLPPELQRDVRALLGSYRQAQDVGGALLERASDPETVLEAARTAEANGVGYMFGEHSLQLHVELVPRLPELLRTLVGCAEKLYGTIDAQTVDLVKLHIWSGKITLLRFDDFEGKPLPRLVERIKINLRTQEVDEFEYGDDKAAPRLTMKSRYMAFDQQGFERQRAFDEKLLAADLIDLSGYGPKAADLARALTRNGYRVLGFDLVRART